MPFLSRMWAPLLTRHKQSGRHMRPLSAVTQFNFSNSLDGSTVVESENEERRDTSYRFSPPSCVLFVMFRRDERSVNVGRLTSSSASSRRVRERILPVPVIPCMPCSFRCLPPLQPRGQEPVFHRLTLPGRRSVPAYQQTAAYQHLCPFRARVTNKVPPAFPFGSHGLLPRLDAKQPFHAVQQIPAATGKWYSDFYQPVRGHPHRLGPPSLSG